MDVLIVVLTTSVIALVLVIITFVIVKRKQTSKYKQEIKGVISDYVYGRKTKRYCKQSK